MTTSYCIFVNELIINTYIGIYDFEKKNSQNVCFDVKLKISKSNLDEINQQTMYDYEEIIKTLKKITTSKHWLLLEDLGNYIIHNFSKDKTIEEIYLKIGKLDIFNDVKNIGVILKYSR